MHVVLETTRLILREMKPDDLDFVAAMLADAEVMRYYPRCYGRREAEQWLQRQLKRYERHGHGLWLAVEKASGQPLGQVGILIQRIGDVDEKEIGYLIHRPFWRQGLATEAAIACRDYAFTQFGRERVLALIRPENAPSLCVAKKLGMQPGENIVYHAGFKHLVFAITQPQWEAMRDAGRQQQ